MNAPSLDRVKDLTNRQLTTKQFLAVTGLFVLVATLGPLVQWGWAAQILPRTLGMATIAGGVLLLAALGLWTWHFRRKFALLSTQGWPLALGLLAGLMTLQLGLLHTGSKFPSGWIKWSLQILFLLIFVGLPEELLFRGIWFALFRNRFVPSVIIGSILFGLIHYVPGIPGRGAEAVLAAFLVGLCFAAARYRGASIACLAVAHAGIDVISTMITAGGAPRFGMTTTIVGMIGGLLFLFAVLLLFPWRGDPKPDDPAANLATMASKRGTTP